jgi:N-acetyl-gamma-glutamyl-phosphate reductase
MDKAKIAIVGATGYTGSELVRLLLDHPKIEIKAITSETYAGQRFSEVHEAFQGFCDIPLVKADAIEAMELDLVFLALPHGVSMNYVKKWHDQPFKIIDFSGDYRLESYETYETWYNKQHTFIKAFSGAAYGLGELFFNEIKNAKLVANPGCFPTGAILALTPLLKAGIIKSEGIIVDAKTGTTGAGVKPKEVTHFSNVNENFKAYGLKKHRHTIEIENITKKASKIPTTVQFTPHLLPVDRGILSTIYAKPTQEINDSKLFEILHSAYKNSAFIRLRNDLPDLKAVRGTNLCDIYCTYDERTNNVIIITAIDNLVKGASGAAVQNMNIMLGFEESLGLTQKPLKP